MKKQFGHKDSSYLLWPIFILLFLTIGIFLTTSETPKQQDIRSRAQVFQNPSLFPSGFAEDIPSPTPTQIPVAKAPPPVEALIDFSFSLPGIASQGGNVTPIHKNRTVVLNFYDSDTNSEISSTHPLFSVHATATYDEDSTSNFYTYFVHQGLDLK